ncbi:transcriptional regulator [Marinomonas primoryensis]|uniref:Transcriptional regulator n=1 Tax=Marinomonas primoryensis TaxID=178399 RepID=A0A2Z4PNX1_9GAMM|nr:FMN-binding negative transcriptional regulator [Marinomonas primoryensis]AWX99235.1 transcriptional regulator [Marinomonas primoryensis]
MYAPKHFEVKDQAELLEFIKAFPFASLVTNGTEGLNADHIPMLVRVDAENKVFLQGHIAKANTLWQKVVSKADVLVIFQGDNAYISPNWYPSKQRDGKAVPTWNYQAVHVKGSIEFIYEVEWKLALLEKLTNTHEQTQSAPWSMSDAPQEYIDRLQAAVVGVEIEVTDIQGKFKLSQNQSDENKSGVREGLTKTKHPMAQLIQKVN